ncbi:transcriptional regulator [Rhodovarius crocodyli]|uniref:Transcriptional regulator n=1 Tax=Rhodovarius crocodyli TaxID=1979269 RepID=A0A437M202_9PROT|nr:helix-turn-helix transcriptional regulator [Rhodovarius crocodyli]RVT91718.1 transcriptional regulator [Rhodovarius crocodyli]
MATTARLAEIAALLGEPARAAMMQALMDGRALTAGELAAAAGITPQTASAHLARLTEAGLLAMERQGRHRYHRLAGAEVAQLLESLMALAAGPRPVRTGPRTGPRDDQMRRARTCYDHLAGRMGVALADALVARGHLELDHDAGRLTEAGAAHLAALGIQPAGGGRLMCRPCLDWSERRPHLAGRLGAALCRHCLDQGWLRRIPGTRAVAATPEGARRMRDAFGLDWA